MRCTTASGGGWALAEALAEAPAEAPAEERRCRRARNCWAGPSAFLLEWMRVSENE